MSRRPAPHRGADVHYGGEPDDALARPSKTRLKEQAQSLQALGQALAGLADDSLAAIEMPEALREAIVAFRKTRSHEGRRRQMQYVGKLMHGADEAALREALAEATLGSAQATLALHQAEQWRVALLKDDAAQTRWLQEHPETDAQQLRSLVRAARRDAAALVPEARQPRSYRELYQFIKPFLARASQTP
jgi:ribosome-associated protein